MRTARIEYMEIDSLLRRRDPNNPKEHDLEALGESMDVNGYVMPMLLDEGTGKLAAGHGRLEKLQRLRKSGALPPDRIVVRKGKWYAPVVRGVTLKEPGKYLIADNRLVEIGGWNKEALASFLTPYGGPGKTFLGTGFAEQDVVHFLRSLQRGGADGGESSDDGMSVKSITVSYPTKDFEETVAKLRALMEREDLDSFTAAFLHLLDWYEKR